MSGIIEARGVRRVYHSGRSLFAKRKEVVAANDINLTVTKGTTFGLIGESGSGKSTVSRMVCGLDSIDAGSITVAGFDVGNLKRQERLPFRRTIQMVFQDSLASLNPYWRIGDLIEEGMIVHDLVPKNQRRDRTVELLEQCGLPANIVDRYPHEFSGGQRQRISIARALAVEPEIIVLDEPVASLDVSIQAQILNLLQNLQDEQGLTYLIVGHDLAVMERFCDRLAVMQRGRIVEENTTTEIVSNPQNPYTQALIQATPIPDPRMRVPFNTTEISTL